MTDTKAKLTLYLQLVRSNIGYESQIWCPQSVEFIRNIEKIQRRATKYILNLGFLPDISYSTKLHQLDLMPITYWHEYLNVVLLYNILNNLVITPENIRPMEILSRTTRHSTVKENTTLRVPFAKTVTFQTSFFVRLCKAWNILDSELTDRNINLNTSKKKLKAYYMRVLCNVFSSDDPRTWKSVCVICKQARSLDVFPPCC